MTTNVEATLKITFMYHCAFAQRTGSPQIDVLMAPPPDEMDHRAEMQHIAGMRIPAEFVNLTETPEAISGTEVVTETLYDGRISERTWELKGYDVWIHTDGPQIAGTSPSSQPDIQYAVEKQQGRFVIADLSGLAGLGIDSACTHDTNVPEFLCQGARVRVWGGRLTCGEPQGGLALRRWDVPGEQHPVGLSDRMVYTKEITAPNGVVRLEFRQFGKGRIGDVLLYPAKGKHEIEIHVTNDPRAEGPHHFTNHRDPCSQLPHFAAYSTLLRPAGHSKPELMAPLNVGAVPEMLIAEGVSVCCPCGYGTPQP